MRCVLPSLVLCLPLFAVPEPQSGFALSVEQAENTARSGDPGAAEAALAEICPQTPAPTLARDGTCRRARGVIAYVRGDFREARRLLTEAAGVFEQVGEDALLPLAATLLAVGESNARLALWQEADAAYSRALALYRRLQGPDSPRAADAMVSLAGLRVAQGIYAEAEPGLIEALAIYERSRSTGNPAHAALLSHMAILYCSTGRVREGLALVKDASAMIGKSLGSDHLSAAASLANLASAYMLSREPARALPLLRKARAAYENALGPDHADVASILMQEGLIDLAAKRTALAGQAVQRAIAIFEKAYGPEHLETLIARSNYALILAAEGRDEAAERLTLDVLERIQGDSPHAVRSRASCHYALGDIYARRQRWPAAIQRYAAALELYEKLDPRDAPELPALLDDYANVLRKDRGQRAKAQGLQERAKALRAR